MTSNEETNRARFNIYEAVLSVVADVSRRLTEIAIISRYPIIPTFDIVEPTQSVTHFK